MVTESAPPFSPSENEGRVGFFSVFTSPALESAFRQWHFRDDLWLSRFLVMAVMLRVSVFTLADYQDFGVGPTFWLLFAGRLLFLLLSASALAALRRAAAPADADRLFFGWGFVLTAMTVSSLSARPPGNTGLLLMSFVTVPIAYCAAPLPLSRQAAFALAYSAAVLYVGRQADTATLSAMAIAYALANLFGAVTSWRLHHRERQRYLGTLQEARLRACLEEAATEIRTLRGLVCICAWCKRIRDEAEAWQAVEEYVQSRTYASFTHGICPDCLHAQRATVVRSRR